jgi:hypothetical protein
MSFLALLRKRPGLMADFHEHRAFRLPARFLAILSVHQPAGRAEKEGRRKGEGKRGRREERTKGRAVPIVLKRLSA